VTLATVNLVTMFGLHRRWHAALIGHLATFEMTSVEPMSRYSHALGRFGISEVGRRFYDAHVTADARHGEIAHTRMVPALVGADPRCAGDLLFGAACVLMLEERFSRHLLDAWSRAQTSLVPWGVPLRTAVPHMAAAKERQPRGGNLAAVRGGEAMTRACGTSPDC